MRMKLTPEQRLADRYLRGFRMVEDRIESSLACLERAEAKRELITGSITGLSLSGAHRDGMVDALASMDDAVNSVRGSAGMFAEQFVEIEDFISEVQRRDAMAGKVLRLVYINRMSVRDIARMDETAFSRKTIYEYLKRGLDEAFDLFLENLPNDGDSRD